MIELKKESGELCVYCAKCGKKLDKATSDLLKNYGSGKFEEVDILCETCNSHTKINVALGVKEYG